MEFTQQNPEYDDSQQSYSLKKQNLEKIISEYRITQNNFNPNKNSPPNTFMDKLEIRMKHYYSKISNEKNY